ncbi:hypothetical protein PHLGIDRAFT_120581 [Phlebiopsis gigantea 11061_1 CR5-6]|uniref:O-methyltransferase domain-containing protein n=1 Tax=Phlebiopsis gigantea (strain 11061_1 CR5-6) TaxID=745531 RepID=A0A0C3S3S7_PHLG1|nr:hypothetical protein PHLGIDRAFT_120581 [Phlebiopsis gigantea 11061_1 CR5-6]
MAQRKGYCPRKGYDALLFEKPHERCSVYVVKNLDRVLCLCAERGVTYPTLEVPPSPETDDLQIELAAQAAPAIAAAYQLIATLQHSQPYLVGDILCGSLPDRSCVRPRRLTRAGSKGLHVNDIAAVRKVDPKKLGRTIRALATRHVFEEISPDVFRNNRISAGMCTGKPVQEMVQTPDDRWDGTNGSAAMISISGSLLLKSAGSLVDNVLDPATALSEEPNESPFSRAYGTELSWYDWLALPEHKFELKRFGIAMGGRTSRSNDMLAAKAHDFFEEQPIKDAAVFVTRYTTHNWSDKYAKKYLTRLRDVSLPDTKLIVIDDIQDYLCRESERADTIPGGAKSVAPAPLLPYPETATSHAYSMDLLMMTIANCQERTLDQFIALLTSAGWKLERIYRFESPLPPQLICSPL